MSMLFYIPQGGTTDQKHSYWLNQGDILSMNRK